MKNLKSLLFPLSAFICMTLISCKYTNDAKIDAFEKSIAKLESKYCDLTPSELERAIKLCEKQLKTLDNSNIDYSLNQKDRISKLKGRYHRLLVKIEVHTMAHDLFDGEDLLEYLKGLISGSE